MIRAPKEEADDIMSRTLKCPRECFPGFRAESPHRLLNGYLFFSVCLGSVEECTTPREDSAGLQSLKLSAVVNRNKTGKVQRTD